MVETPREASLSADDGSNLKTMDFWANADGTIDAAGFAHGVQRLFDGLDAIDGHWKDETSELLAKASAQGYGVLTPEMRRVKCGDVVEESNEVISADEILEDEVDDASIVPNHCGYLREYRIVYSPTFRVPVLCVRARDAATRRIWSTTKFLHALRSEQSHPDTDDNHALLAPYLNPHEREDGDWACVHPCATARVMALLSESNTAGSLCLRAEAYLRMWLSAFAREINLEI